MQITETVVRPTQDGLSIEMTIGSPDDEQSTPYIRFRMPLAAHPEGRLPLQEWQKAALERVHSELREQISRLSAT